MQSVEHLCSVLCQISTGSVLARSLSDTLETVCTDRWVPDEIMESVPEHRASDRKSSTAVGVEPEPVCAVQSRQRMPAELAQFTFLEQITSERQMIAEDEQAQLVGSGRSDTPALMTTAP